MNAQIERVNCRPWGLEGGLSGAGNQITVERAGEPERYFPSGKVLSHDLYPGDRFTLRSGGGGGFGSAIDRDLHALEHDLVQGYVSLEMAERLYGAVVDPQSMSIDPAASARRREEMAAAALPTDEQGIPSDSAELAAVAEPHQHRAADHDDYELRLQLSLARRCC